MRAWIRLGLAAVVIVAAIVGIRLAGGNAILLEDVQAASHGGALIGVTMTIRNTGKPDRLVSAHVEGAKMAIVKGENAQPLPIPANAKVSLAMDGAHIMLGGVPGEIKDGVLIPMTLTFENAGKVQTKAHFGKPMMDHGGIKHGASANDAKAGDAMAMMGMDYVVPDGEPAPTLSISTAPRAGGGFTVSIETTNFRFSKEAADGPHEAGVGHGHLYVGGVKLGRVYGNSVEVPRLPSGEQIVRVTLNTNDHRTYLVEGELVTATAIVSE